MAQRVLQEPVALDYANGFHATLSGTSQASSAFAGVSALLIAASGGSGAHFVTGANPTAVADGTSGLLPSGAAMVIAITPGDKIAVIQAGIAGEFTATPVA